MSRITTRPKRASTVLCAEAFGAWAFVFFAREELLVDVPDESGSAACAPLRCGAVIQPLYEANERLSPTL